MTKMTKRFSASDSTPPVQYTSGKPKQHKILRTMVLTKEKEEEIYI
jgi:hypothetical protein